MTSPDPTPGPRTTRRRVLASTFAALAALALRTQTIAADGPNPSSVRRLKDVNTTDLPGAIRLACRTMGSVFNPDDHDIPFFASQVRPTPLLAFNDNHSEAHVPGRHLNALLHAEAVAGQSIDPAVIEKHERAAFFALSGPLPLPLNRERIDGKPIRFLPHNLRESFHALHALARYRNSTKARDLAERGIAAIFDLWDPQRGWDRKRIEARGLRLIEWGGPFVTGIARAIGPLVKYYAATGHQPALRLALLLKDKAVAEVFLPDGDYDPARFGTHTHSTTCVMSSLAYLAELTRDAALMDRVRRFFDNGLTRVSDAIGWSIENTSPQAIPDRGEANNTGDILETALALGRWGHAEYFGRAERILRGHLLPCQLRDTSFIPDGPPIGAGGSVAQRHLGAFGFPAPYGHQPLGAPDISFNMDIVGGATDSLCFALENAVTATPAGHHVNLLFDRETDALKIESPYTTPDGRLRLTPRTLAPLFVRLPAGVDPAAIQIDGAPTPPRTTNGYLVLTDCPAGRPVTLKFDLPTTDLTLKHRTHDIRTRLRGDAVIAMDNFGTDLTFFPPIDGSQG